MVVEGRAKINPVFTRLDPHRVSTVQSFVRFIKSILFFSNGKMFNLITTLHATQFLS